MPLPFSVRGTLWECFVCLRARVRAGSLCVCVFVGGDVYGCCGCGVWWNFHYLCFYVAVICSVINIIAIVILIAIVVFRESALSVVSIVDYCSCLLLIFYFSCS